MLKVKEFRQERGLSAGEMVAVVRENYPGYDKYIHSKVENPEKYGIRLVSDAERLLEEAFLKTAPAARKPDRRRLPCRVHCRLSKGRFEQLQQAFNRAGFQTMQCGLDYIIGRYLEELHGG